MKNNGMIVYKESFITKIKNIFKKLFGKHRDTITLEKNENEFPNAIQENAKERFITEIKVDSDKVNAVQKKNNILEKLKGNKEKLNMLSIERLKKLEKYYDNIIEQNEIQIKKLKASA